MSEEKIMKFSDERLADIAPTVYHMVDNSRDIKAFAMDELTALGFTPDMEVAEPVAEAPMEEPIMEEEVMLEEEEAPVRSDEELKADLQKIIDAEDTEKKVIKDAEELVTHTEELSEERVQNVKNVEDFLAENVPEVEEVEVTEEVTIEEAPVV